MAYDPNSEEMRRRRDAYGDSLAQGMSVQDAGRVARRGDAYGPPERAGIRAAAAPPQTMASMQIPERSGISAAKPPAQLKPYVDAGPRRLSSAGAVRPMQGGGQQAGLSGIIGRGNYTGAGSDAEAQRQNPALYQERLPSGHGAGMTQMYLRAAEMQRGNKLREARNQMTGRLGGLASAQGSPAMAAIEQRIASSDAAYNQQVDSQQGRVADRQSLASGEGIAALQDETTRRGQDYGLAAAQMEANAKGGQQSPGIFRQELDRQGARKLTDLRESAQQSTTTLGQLESMSAVLNDGGSGFYRDKLGSLDTLLGGALGLRDKRQAFDAFSNFMTAQSAQNILTGVLTQKDMELFKKAMPSYDKPPEVNGYLIDFYTKAFRNGMDRVKAMEDYAGQYGTLEGFDDSQFRSIQLDPEALANPDRAASLMSSPGQSDQPRTGIAGAAAPPNRPQSFAPEQIDARGDELAAQGLSEYEVVQKLTEEGLL